MPAIYKETVIDKDLITELDLGQIKHITDRGLDKRTAAYELLTVLLDTAVDAVNVADFIDPLVRGMDDMALTIKESTYKTMKRLAIVAGGQVYAHLDKLLPILEKELKRPIPKNEPQERLLVMKRAAVAGIPFLFILQYYYF